MQSVCSPLTALSSSQNKVINDALNKQKLVNNDYCLFRNLEKYFFPPKEVLIISKKTKLQWEISSNISDFYNKTDSEFLSKLRSLDNISSEIKEKHFLHIKYVSTIVVALKKHGIKIKIINFDEYTEDCLKGFDLVVTAGGDGTFLMAASKIKNDIPIIGLNSDSEGSEGHLCIGKKMNISPHIIIDNFLIGNFDWMYRQRITVIVKQRKQDQKDKKFGNKKSLYYDSETYYVLNEVFISEIDASKASYFDISLNDGEPIKQKNSGVSICTGTGSTAWHFNMNKLTSNKLESIVQILEDMGVKFENKNENFINETCNRFNQQLIFDPSYCQMAYTFREPIYNNTFRQISQTGFTTKIKITSRCSNGCIVLDGNNSIPFHYGTEVLLQMFPEDALRTIYMNL